MRSILLACVLSVLSSQARADDWPEHGFYRVRDGVEQGGRYCELLGELNVSGAIFALVIRENASGSLMTQFLAQSLDPDKVKELIVGLDGKEMFRFVPEIRKSKELPSVAAFFSRNQGQAIIEQLHTTAKSARWLDVVAPPYKNAVPAEGLGEAMDDMIACRTAKRV